MEPLKKKHVSQLYERATAYESIFRSILVDFAGDKKEADFCKTASLDELFRYHVSISGNVRRVTDFRVGPFENETKSGSTTFQGCKTYKNYRTDFSKLSDKDAVILLEDPEDLMLRGYKVLDDSSLKLTRFENRHQV